MGLGELSSEGADHGAGGCGAGGAVQCCSLPMPSHFQLSLSSG